jgi:small membrane protein
MTLFQILILIIISIIIYKAAKRFYKKEISAVLFILWTLFWLVVATINLFPSIISKAAEFFGIGRGVDLLIYLSIIILVYVNFKQYLRLNKIERNFYELIRRISIEKAKKGEDKQ